MAHGAGGAPDIYQEQVAFRERKMDFEGIKHWMVGSTLVGCSPFFGGMSCLSSASYVALRSPSDLRPLQQLAWHSSLLARICTMVG